MPWRSRPTDGPGLGGCDGTVRLWDVANGNLLGTLVGTPEGWVVFTPDGRYKVSGPVAGPVWFAINLCRFELGELDDSCRASSSGWTRTPRCGPCQAEERPRFPLAAETTPKTE